jgi:hypothetical protein
MLARSKQAYIFGSRNHMRQAVWLAALAVLFLVFAYLSRGEFLSAYLGAFGVLVLLGAAFAFFNSRKLARLSAAGAQRASGNP